MVILGYKLRIGGNYDESENYICFKEKSEKFTTLCACVDLAVGG